MEALKNISRNDIEEKLVGENLQTNRILSLAMCGGSLVFFIFIVFLYNKNVSENMKVIDNSLTDMMTIVLLVLGMGLYAASLIYPKIYWKKKNIEPLFNSSVSAKYQTAADSASILIGADRSLMILRLAMMNGVTLFGLVCLYLAAGSGELYLNSNYWFLATPMFIFILVVLTNFISKEKYISRIENAITLLNNEEE